MLHAIKSFVIEEPQCWLDIISVWRNLHGCEGKKEDVSQENGLPLKRRKEETNTATKRLKTEQVRERLSEECQVETEESCGVPEGKTDQDCCNEGKASLAKPSASSGEKSVAKEKLSFSFRVSCRCSGAVAKILPSQEVGRAVGIALMKQFGWQADLRDPELEIFVHLNDIHSVVGIPLFRLPLANREYIQTAGLRSTVAWAMASLAEIRVFGGLVWILVASSKVQDPMLQGWVMFVSVFCFVLSTTLLCLYICGVHRGSSFWVTLDVICHETAALFYLSAGVLEAYYTYALEIVSVIPEIMVYYQENIAAVVFAFVATLLYVIHTVGSLRRWKSA